MPASNLQSIADQSGKPLKDIEGYWEKAKKLAKEAGHEEEYDYITGIVKKMAGLGEQMKITKRILAMGRKLNEGTWAMPTTKKQAQDLANLLKKTITAKEVNDNKIANLVGSDDLYDFAFELIDDGEPDASMNSMIITQVQKWVRDFQKDGSGFKKQFEPEAIKILLALKEK